MNPDQLTQLYDDVRSLREQGKETEAQALLIKHLHDLPEEMQGEILLGKFTDAMEGEAAALQARRDIQQMGLEAAERIITDESANS